MTSPPAALDASAVDPARGRPPGRLQPPTPRVALLLVAAVIVGILLYLARGSLSPFVLGLVLVYVMDPAVQRVSRLRLAGRRLPRGLVVLLIYVIVVVVLVWAVTALVGPLVQQVAAFAADLPAVLAALDEWYRRLALPDPIRNAIDDVLAGLGRATGGLDPGQVLPIARSLAGVVASLFGYLIIPVWAFYLLKDRPALAASANHAIPPTWRRDVWACVGIVNRVFGRWLRAQLFLGVVVGIATFVGLQILGAVVDPRFGDFAILLAVVAGILELLPIIGPILSMIPTLLIALTVRDPVQGLIAVLILYLIVQQLENNVLVPIVQGDAIDLHPSVVILALIVGGAIAGFLGAVFALPLTAAGRDVYRYFFRRLSEDDPAVPPADDPELLPFRDRLPDREGRLPTERTDVPADDPAADRPAPADGTHPAPPRQAVEQGG